MLRHDLTNGRHLMPVGRLHESTPRTRTSSTCGGSGGGGGGGGGGLNRVSVNDLNQKLLWRAEGLSPMSEARKRLFRKLAITLLLINIERLEELDRIDEDDGEQRVEDVRPHAEKVHAAFSVGALESYSIKNAKPSQHSPAADHRLTPIIEPSPVVDDSADVVDDDDDDKQIWLRKPKKTLSWRVKPSDALRHNNATKAIGADRKKPKRQSFAD
uniref:Uncharacterized protein n=1 Tax=Plectus sambesii TaxID=2011161 RepID=A0A914VFX2_9BILA